MVGVAEWKELLPTSEALHSLYTLSTLSLYTLSTLSLHSLYTLSLYTLSTLSIHSPGSRLARPWPVLRPVYGQPDLTLALRCSYHGPSQLAWRSAYLPLPTYYLPTYLPTSYHGAPLTLPLYQVRPAYGQPPATPDNLST